MRIQAERHVQDPTVTMSVELDKQTTDIVFSETCHLCAGYGSPCRGCVGGKVYKPVADVAALRKEIGQEGLSLLTELLETVVTSLRRELHRK